MKNATDVPQLTLTYAPKKKSASPTPILEWCACFCTIIFVLILVLIFAWIVMQFIDVRDPRVALESISVSLHDNGTTARWDVGISIKNRNSISYLQFGEVGMWVNYMSESSSQTVSPAFKLGVGETVFVKGSVESSLTDHARSQLVHGSVVDVLLKAECRHPRYLIPKRTVKIACGDIGVGVLSGASRERKYCFEVRDGPFIYVSPGIYVRPGRRAISPVATIPGRK